jgi:hypothetical protein
MQSRPHSYVEQCARKRMGNLGGLLVVIFSPVNIGQFQRPSPTELIQFHCALVGALLLGGFTASSWATLTAPP